VALMRRPLASQTTEAGFGLSFTGQLGIGGGVTATGAGSCFFTGWRMRDLWGGSGAGAEVAGTEVGWDGDCAEIETLEGKAVASSAPESITHRIAGDEIIRDCSVANIRMRICSPGLRAPGSTGLEPPHCIRLSVAVERSYRDFAVERKRK
jgi:hypothetical protein